MKIRTVLMCLLAVISVAASARVPVKNPSAFDKGVEAFTKNDYTTAETCFGSALQTNPDNAYAKAYLGSVYRMQGRYTDAVRMLEPAVDALAGDDAVFAGWAAYERFLSNMELRDSAAALVDIDRAIDLAGDVSEYFEARAFLRYALHNRTGAADDIVVALSTNTDGDTQRAETLTRVLGAYEHDYVEQLLRNQASAQTDKADYWHALADGLADDAESFGEGTVEEREITDSDDVRFPEFRDGADAMRDYLDKQTGYNRSTPPVKVNVEITVDESGNVVDAQLVKGCDNARLNSRAVAICKAMPKFTPAMHNGEARRCKMTLSLRFPNTEK